MKLKKNKTHFLHTPVHLKGIDMKARLSLGESSF